MDETTDFFWLGEINKASVVTNAEAGLIDMRVARKTAQAIVEVERRVASGEATAPASYIAYEPLLIAAADPEISLVHAGRSSQDILSTMRVARGREAVLNAAGEVSRLIGLLLELAHTHVATIVPAYTNGVAAQPTSLGHTFEAYAEMLLRDEERLMELLDRYDASSMGATVLNGTGWPLNRSAMAEALGFAKPVANAFDATCLTPVDMPLELAGVAASFALHVGEILGEIMVQYAQPRPWMLLVEGGANTYVSSAMPQKRNPGLINNARAEASDLLSCAQATFVRVHNVVPGMVDGKSTVKNGELAKRFAALANTLERVMTALVVDKDRAIEELNLDWTASQEVADRLMKRHGLPFRVGHHVASAVVSAAKREGLTPLTTPYAYLTRAYAEVVAKEYPEAPAECPMSEAEWKAALDPVDIVRARATPGSAAPAEVHKLVAAARERLESLNARAQAKRERIALAHEKLSQRFEHFLA